LAMPVETWTRGRDPSRPLARMPKSATEGTRVSMAEAMAEMHLLGHGRFADDEESQAFKRDVERSNRRWCRGQIPRLPKGYANGVALRAAVTRPVIERRVQ